MQEAVKLPFLTMLLMISFASVNAMLFTPALPDIANFFAVTDAVSQQTITWFLIAYACGQLIYGPIANRFGRKKALFVGIILQIVSSIICALSKFTGEFFVLVLGRFLLALGSGVGLKMTFTLINECHPAKVASQKISYLMLAFAIMPGLSIALGGYLNGHFGWASCFYAGAIYGLILIVLVKRLPETLKNRNYNSLKLAYFIKEYKKQFTNKVLLAGGFLMGLSTCFSYIFAALGPFIVIEIFHLSSTQYGLGNLLPPVGIILGSLSSSILVTRISHSSLILFGISVCAFGITLMLLFLLLHESVLFSIFLPLIVIYYGLSFILANASTLAMNSASDIANGSSVMNFINIGTATLAVLSLSLFKTNQFILPMMFVLLCALMWIVYKKMIFVK